MQSIHVQRTTESALALQIVEVEGPWSYEFEINHGIKMCHVELKEHPLVGVYVQLSTWAPGREVPDRIEWGPIGKLTQGLTEAGFDGHTLASLLASYTDAPSHVFDAVAQAFEL